MCRGDVSFANDASSPTVEAVCLISAGLGLVIAAYGIIRVAAQTDLETEAVGRYQGPPSASPLVSPPGISRALSGGAGGKALSVSLWSLTF
jgi:hypothetical protein